LQDSRFGLKNVDTDIDKRLLTDHASVVPESEEKHSDTTQQNIQMLKDQLD